MRRPQSLLVAVVTGAAIEIGLISVARPFTVLADVVVSIALAAMVGVVASQRSPRTPALLARRPLAASEDEGRTVWPWLVALVVVAVWELVAFLGSPRPDHPTLSYLTDLITVHPAGRALMFAGWLALGGYLVTA